MARGPRPWLAGRNHCSTPHGAHSAGQRCGVGTPLRLNERGGARSRLSSRSTGTADITAVRTGCAAVQRQHHTDHESPPPICRAGLRAMQQLQGPIWSLRLLVSCCQLSCRTTTVAGVSASPGTTPGRQTSLCVAWPRGSVMHLRHRGGWASAFGFGQYPWSRLPCTVAIRSAAVSKSRWL